MNYVNKKRKVTSKQKAFLFFSKHLLFFVSSANKEQLTAPINSENNGAEKNVNKAKIPAATFVLASILSTFPPC